MRILVIEDDSHTLDYLAKGLTEAGHNVDTAADGRDGLFLALSQTQSGAASGAKSGTGVGSDAGGTDYDLAIVDRMLPGLDGLSIVRSLRASDNHLPVLILSALDSVDHRVEGLRAGGDDYLVKPFAFTELLARVEALARRREPEQTHSRTHLRVDELELDLLGRHATRAGQRISLQPREFRLLEFLMRRASQVVTRTMLLEGVWDYHFDPQTNVVDVHISRLRRKIDRDFDHPLLHTVRGAGYSLYADQSGGEPRGGAGAPLPDEPTGPA